MSDHDAVTAVRRYQATRYRSPDQRLVNALESRVIHRHLDAVCHADSAVLDVASGYGRFTDAVVKRGADVVVTDNNQAMLSVTRDRLGARVKPVRLISAQLPFPDNRFDVVLCIRLLQHLHDSKERVATLSEIARVCRGAAIVTTYLASPLHSLAHRLRGLKRLTRHDPAQLAADLEEAGLRQVELTRPLTRLHAQTVLLLKPVA